MTRFKEEIESSTDQDQKAEDNSPEWKEEGKAFSGGENSVSRGGEAGMWPEGTRTGVSKECAQESPGNSLTWRFS